MSHSASNQRTEWSKNRLVHWSRSRLVFGRFPVRVSVELRLF
jgi:hypothetical protein